MKKTFCLLLMLLFLGLGTAMAGTCPPGPPTSRGNGQVAGVAVAGGTQYYFKDALLGGFACFAQLSSWFPSYFTSSSSISPTHVLVDMAYATAGTATFFNVSAPQSGIYTLTVRYAYASGLFPGITDRPEGIMVNGTVITTDMHFPITGSFETFENSSISVPLNVGANTIQMFNVSDDGVSRVDAMTLTRGGSSGCTGAPTAPGGLSATAVSSSQINLGWTASTAPSGCTVGYYDVFRSTTAGFTPSSSNQIASGVTNAFYDDTKAACGTTFHYAVEAVDSAAASAASAQAGATTPACSGGSTLHINSGGPAVAPFVADEFFSGGGAVSHSDPINLTGVTNPAPMAVYQTARTGNFTYTIPGYTAGSSHTVRLHFAEPFFTAAGKRVFNVSINGTQVLTNFDIFAAAGAEYKAVIEQFMENANSSGQYVITFTSVVNQSLVSGIEIQ
ncbi:MAG TPA: malectin domain-containing carbohydrate-binding protein [Terriglobales bacterium]|jgi:hypothetical protein|nr:malectin domain-containing carbohydrate-binding protein [Terriglobales bacterium]